MTYDQQNDIGETSSNQNSSSFSDQDIPELLSGYVLGALEADERLALERYIGRHPEMHDHLRNLEMTAASLAHAAPRAPLPTRLRAQLLHQVRGNAPVQHARRLPLLGKRAVKLQRPALRGMRPIPRSQAPAPAAHRHWFSFFLRSLATAGALAAIALLALVSWQLYNQTAQLSSQLATVQGEVAQLQAVNLQLQQNNEELQQQLQNQTRQWEVIADPHQLITLAGTPNAPSASGAFFQRNNESVLVLHGLPPLPEDQTYQLWILPPEGPSIPAALLSVNTTQTTHLAVNIPSGQSDLAGVSISVEPAGGSQTPTAIVLLGRNSTINP